MPKWCGKWAIDMSEYSEGNVGGKSRNLAGLRGELPSDIALPASVTLPFGCFEEVRQPDAWRSCAVWLPRGLCTALLFACCAFSRPAWRADQRHRVASVSHASRRCVT